MSGTRQDRRMAHSSPGGQSRRPASSIRGRRSIPTSRAR